MSSLIKSRATPICSLSSYVLVVCILGPEGGGKKKEKKKNQTYRSPLLPSSYEALAFVEVGLYILNMRPIIFPQLQS